LKGERTSLTNRRDRRLCAHAGHAHELDGVSEADIRREHANDWLGLSGRRLQLWSVEPETHSDIEVMGSSGLRRMRRGSPYAWKRFARAGAGCACRSSTGASRARRGMRHGKVYYVDQTNRGQLKQSAARVRLARRQDPRGLHATD
jgi:hypothetical protein